MYINKNNINNNSINDINDLNPFPNNYPSMCIPRVLQNISEQHIREIINKLNIGIIYRIDIINKKSHNRVFIHFSRWFNTENAEKARTILLNGKDIKVIYKDPWFWKIYAYRETYNNIKYK